MRVLDAVSNFEQRNNQIAVLKFIEIVLPPESDVNALAEVISQTDLACYVSLSALLSCSRKELKNTVLKSANYVNLTSSVNEAAAIVE